MTYKKIQCFKCKSIQVTKVEKPKCSKCGSRRFNNIDELPIVTEFNKKNTTDVVENRIKVTKKEEKPKEKETYKEEVKEMDEVDRDLWG